MGGSHVFPVFQELFVFLLVEQIVVPSGVEIEERAALFQDTVPGHICLVRVLEDPGHVPGDDEIESVIGERQVLCVHLQEQDVVEDTGLFRIGSRLFQHGFGIVDRHDFMAEARQSNGKETGTGPDVEDPFRSPVDAVLPKDRKPAFQAIRGKFCIDEIGVAGSPAAPVLFDLLQQSAGRNGSGRHRIDSPNMQTYALYSSNYSNSRVCSPTSPRGGI